MYCKICGNLLDDTDQSCKICGTAVEHKEKPAEPMEEVIFNPPFEEEKTEVPFGSFADPVKIGLSEPEPIKKVISDLNMEPVKDLKSEPVKMPDANQEFKWNIYEFPKAKRTEDIAFNWNPDSKEEEKKEEITIEALEQALFKDIKEDAIRNQDTGIEKFLTFSRKNEEFQELLDREYERLRKRSEYDFQPKSVEPELPADFVLSNRESIDDESESTVVPEPPADSILSVEPESSVAEPPAEPETVPESAAVAKQEIKHDTKPKTDHIEEMANARALFFSDEIVQDNETIIKKLEADDTDNMIAEAVAEPADIPAADNHVAESVVTPAAAEKTDQAVKQDEKKDDKPDEESSGPVPKEKKKKIHLGKAVLVAIVIILVAEITILGIRYFAPESTAAEQIGAAQSRVIDTIIPWIGNVKDMFTGKDKNEKTDQDNSKDKVQDEDKATEVSTQDAGQIPDSAPASDKNKLVASQLSLNKNIQVVKANETLTYDQNKNYGITDLDQSKPIENNIWMTPANGDVVYYDQSVVGTVIAFDSQWIDYVNRGSSSVLELLKKNSKAYWNAVNYSKVGKIKENFKLLEIGEIRQGLNGFYVWVHEEIQTTENEKTMENKYNWIYYLEPVDGTMKIVNYYKF